MAFEPVETWSKVYWWVGRYSLCLPLSKPHRLLFSGRPNFQGRWRSKMPSIKRPTEASLMEGMVWWSVAWANCYSSPSGWDLACCCTVAESFSDGWSFEEYRKSSVAVNCWLCMTCVLTVGNYELRWHKQVAGIKFSCKTGQCLKDWFSSFCVSFRHMHVNNKCCLKWKL